MQPNGSQPMGMPNIPNMPHFPSAPGDPAIQLLRQSYASDGQLYVEYVVVSTGRTLSVWLTGEDCVKWAANLSHYGEHTKAGLLVNPA